MERDCEGEWSRRECEDELSTSVNMSMNVNVSGA